MDNLFAYGSLMCTDIMLLVSGENCRSSRGTIQGYQRLKVRDECHPGLVRGGDKVVEGVVYHNLTKDCWNRLDRFEGLMYERETIDVVVGATATILANAYLVKLEYRDRLKSELWDYEEFLKSGKNSFVDNYLGFGAVE